MMPFTPMNDNINRSLESLERGDPEEGSPAAQGGIGADTADLGAAGEALKQEGVLDETLAEQTKDD